MAWYWWLVLGWVACGFIAYGLTKGDLKRFYRTVRYVGYGFNDELISWLYFLIGPMGIVGALFICCLDRQKPSWCLKMPEDLKEGYGERRF